MIWNTLVPSNECVHHPDYLKGWRELCCLVGKCTYENCPIKDGNVEREKAMELTDD